MTYHGVYMCVYGVQCVSYVNVVTTRLDIYSMNYLCICFLFSQFYRTLRLKVRYHVYEYSIYILSFIMYERVSETIHVKHVYAF